MTDLLTQLLSRCECEVVLTVNEHRNYHQTVYERVDELCDVGLQRGVELADEIRDGILRTGNVIELQFFQRTPLISHTVIHYDVNEAIREALALLDVENMP